MSKAAMKKLHLPFPPEMHACVKWEPEASGTPTTALAPQAVTEWLDLREREWTPHELRAFALEHAGSDLDLDDEFADSAHETLAEHAG